jgi:hypothetical protein
MSQAMAPALYLLVLPLAFAIDRDLRASAYDPPSHDHAAHPWLRTELLSIAKASDGMPVAVS